MADSDELGLIVEGRRYSGFKAISVTQSIESLSGKFSLEVSDRWGGLAQPWPIVPEDSCVVAIGDDVVIDGFVDSADLSMAAGSRSLSYTGKDRAAALVENSMSVEGASVKGKKWTYRNIDIAQFARAIAEPFGVSVSVQSGLELSKAPLLVAHPGETGFEAIKRAAGSVGVMIVADNAGGIVITRAGTDRAAPLIEGDNIETISVARDFSDRFYSYLISTQIPGTDEASGEATRVQAEANDLGVRRRERVTIIRPDKGYNTEDAQRRADWEARTRAARSETVNVGVVGWRQPSGKLWPVNARTFVNAPSAGVVGDMLISQVERTIGEGGGQLTKLRLLRPDAFLPEIQATVAATGGRDAWNRFTKGP